MAEKKIRKTAPALFRMLCPLILASVSPRRKNLFQEVGLDLPVVTADSLGMFSEPLPKIGQEPEDYAREAAMAKTLPVAAHHPEACVIGADTIVALGKEILGKPKNTDEAFAMLCRLNGRRHCVITACAIARPGLGPVEQRLQLLADATDVFFGQWPANVLKAYATCGEPMDKAGAYAIQGMGGALITGIHGSWNTVVGLPLPLVIAYLLKIGSITPASYN